MTLCSNEWVIRPHIIWRDYYIPRERSKDMEGSSSGLFEGRVTDVAGIDCL
jgi:hypothetical protein